MPGIFEHRRKVTDQEIDSLGRANNQAYLAWMLEAASAHSAAQGWREENYLALGGCWVVRRHEIEYLNPALPGDGVAVHTWVSAMERVASERRYEMRRTSDGKILAKAATLWVWIDMKTGRPARIPAEVAAAFDVAAGPAPAGIL